MSVAPDRVCVVIGRTRHKMTHEVTVERLSLADRINELAERLDQTPRVGDECRPLGRQRHSARRAVEQPPPERRLQPLDLKRDGRLAPQQPFGGPREAEVLGDREKGAQEIEIQIGLHDLSLQIAMTDRQIINFRHRKDRVIRRPNTPGIQPMADTLALAQANLLSPVVLFFALGLLAALARSDLSMPEAFAKGLSLFLMLAIGFKGGAAVATHGLTWQIGLTAAAGTAFSFLIPFLAYALLRLTSRLDGVTAAAVAAHYGSVSLVTFVAAVGFGPFTGVLAITFKMIGALGEAIEETIRPTR